MKVLRKVVAGAIVAASLCTGIQARAVAAPTHQEIKLDYGINEVKLGKMSLRILRGMVANGTASSFDTFTVYLIPDNTGDPWLQVTTSSPKGLGYNFRNYESGDANTQAIAFYTEGGHLFAVQATKVGPAADARGSHKTPFDFEIVQFNESEEIPLFNGHSKRRSKGQYVDGRDAIDHEFFGRIRQTNDLRIIRGRRRTDDHADARQPEIRPSHLHVHTGRQEDRVLARLTGRSS